MRGITRAKLGLKTAMLRSRVDLALAPLAAPFVPAASLGRLLRWCRRAAALAPREAIVRDRTDLYARVAAIVADDPIDYFEFGVWKGMSFRWWLRNHVHPGSRFVGFDTFTGLPESWGYYDRGHFDTGQVVPRVEDPRARFEVGLFQETLGAFLRAYDARNRRVVNIDADLYSSTLFVLASLAPVLRAGDVILFDELLAWRTPAHQFRALEDFASAFYVDYRFLGAARCFEKVAITVATPSGAGRGRMLGPPGPDAPVAAEVSA